MSAKSHPILLFRGPVFYPPAGICSLAGTFASPNDAIEAAMHWQLETYEEIDDFWWQVVDAREMTAGWPVLAYFGCSAAPEGPNFGVNATVYYHFSDIGYAPGDPREL